MRGILAALALSLSVAGCSTTPTSYTTTPTPAPIETGGNWINVIVSAHNQVRAALGLNPLSWSPNIAAYAQEWAQHLAQNQGCQMIHRAEARNNPADYGENLYWASPLQWSDGRQEMQPISAASVANDWASEARFYDYNNNSCQRGEQCGHYTQMVWRNTQQIGCGMAVCPNNGQIWVCSYNPAGNWVGERPY